MNKNKKLSRVYKKGAAALLAAAMVVTSGGVVPASTYAAKNNDKAAITTEKVGNASSNTSNSDELSKEETVYADLNADGSTSKVTVSDWLKNSNQGGSILDTSNLNDIKNIKGNEKFSQDGSSLTWSADKNDIYYQGTTDEELPVGVSIKYFLNDVEVTDPKDLIGKSGDFEMDIQYQNMSKKTIDVNGESKDIYTPFLMATTMILPNDKFTDIGVDNGRIISEGDNTIVLGYGLPGLKESLNLDDTFQFDESDLNNIDMKKITDKITDSVKITAHVEDFELGETYTIASSEFFSDTDMNNDDLDENEDDLNEKLDDLDDAIDKLIDGADKLSDGTGKLSDKFSDYKDGVKKLKNGTKKINDNAPTLKKGMNDYTKGADKLLKGVKTYANGTKTLAEGTKDYTAGAKKVVDGIGNVNNGANKLKDGSADFNNKLQTYVDTVNSQLKPEDMTKIADSFADLHDGIGKAKVGVDNLAQLAGSLPEILSAASSLVNGKTLEDKNVTVLPAKTLSDNLMTQMAEYAKKYAEDTNNAETIKQALLNTYGNKLSEMSEKDKADAQSKVIQGILLSKDSTFKALYNSYVYVNYAGTVGNKIAGGLGDIDSANLGDSLTKLNTGMDKLYTSTDPNNENIKQIASGAAALTKLKKATNELGTAYATQLNPGITALATGSAALYTASQELTANNKKLNDGADKLIKNTSAIISNSDKLTSNSSKLRSGADKLSDGMNTLYKGAVKLYDATGKVGRGINKLDKGADKLEKGARKFKRKGIDKISDSINELLDAGDELKDRVRGLSDAADEYKSFSGISDGMDGSVKFILKTSEVKSDDDDD
jgi:putative membrane protein